MAVPCGSGPSCSVRLFHVPVPTGGALWRGTSVSSIMMCNIFISAFYIEK